jgi:chromosome segregation ATPase
MQRKSINESDLFDWENDNSDLDDSIGEPPIKKEFEPDGENVASLRVELGRKTKQLEELSSVYKDAQDYIEKLREHYYTKKEMYCVIENDNRELNKKLLVVQSENAELKVRLKQSDSQLFILPEAKSFEQKISYDKDENQSMKRRRVWL